jgi:hypothetical protein
VHHSCAACQRFTCTRLGSSNLWQVLALACILSSMKYRPSGMTAKNAPSDMSIFIDGSYPYPQFNLTDLRALQPHFKTEVPHPNQISSSGRRWEETESPLMVCSEQLRLPPWLPHELRTSWGLRPCTGIPNVRGSLQS